MARMFFFGWGFQIIKPEFMKCYKQILILNKQNIIDFCLKICLKKQNTTVVHKCVCMN